VCIKEIQEDIYFHVRAFMIYYSYYPYDCLFFFEAEQACAAVSR